MSERVDLYSAYGNFSDPVLDVIRKETFGVDIGQNSWVTSGEYERFLPALEITPDHHVLEVASGSGGPALYVARALGCRVTGVDNNESAVATATRLAAESKQADKVQFQIADASTRLPFDDDTFDALICIDAINHLPERLAVLREWHRVLRPGRKALFTDPVVITGPVTNDELALRSSVGLFLFVPSGTNEALIEGAGLRLVRQDDVSDNAVLIASRWHRARQAHRAELLRIEGHERFEGLQRFFEAVRDLTNERRLTRIAYVVEKPD